MIDVIEAARSRGIKVLLDLVAGHTSVDHPWFEKAANDPDDNRYIWSDQAGPDFVAGPGARDGWYMKNFFESQPALNFGYSRLDENEPWRQLPSDPGPQENVQALKDIIAFWLDKGVAGFRVDMAYSLVKDDPDLSATTALWHGISEWLDAAYPDCVLIPETDEDRTVDAGVRGGFDADFFLVIQREHAALFNNGASGVLPWQEGVEPCYFSDEVSVAEGTAALERFLGYWNEHQVGTGGDQLVVLPSSDHDFSRLAAGTRGYDQLFAAYTFLLTWGSLPSIYYGDEIGMRNVEGSPSKEGSRWNPGYDRSGCRTPMQWDTAEVNDGFSSAPTDVIYLPQDSDPGRPSVADQENDKDSLLSYIRRLISVRRDTPELTPRGSLEVLSVGYPFVYLRGGRYLVVVNPRGDDQDQQLAVLETARSATVLAGEGVTVEGSTLKVTGFGHAVIDLEA